MPDLDMMVKLLRELNRENQLIAQGGLMALKAQQDLAHNE